MVFCLAGLANNEIKLVEPRIVQLMGPQITPAALAEWQRLAQSQNFDLRIYINDGDPVPRVSYLASYLVPNAAPSVGQRVGAIPNVLKEAVFGTGLQAQIEKEVPAAKGLPPRLHRRRQLPLFLRVPRPAVLSGKRAVKSA